MATNSREVLHSSASVEWYTPARFIEAARRVMGSIDLDPASCASANQQLVKAKEYFDQSKDGLKQKWHGNVFLNPPYGRGGQSNWSKKMIAEYDAQNFDQGILLVNSATGNLWFKHLWRFPICFVEKRIKFVSADDATKHSPTHGNVFVYMGPKRNDFVYEFMQFGPVVTKVVR